MVEVAIAAVIFTLSVAGILTTIGYTGNSSLSEENRTKASLWGAQIFNQLNQSVNSSIDTGSLSIGTHAVANDLMYPGLTASYLVSTPNAGEVCRKVALTINW